MFTVSNFDLRIFIWFSELLRRAVWWKFTDVSHVLTAGPGQSGTGTRFLRVVRFSPQCHLPVASYSGLITQAHPVATVTVRVLCLFRWPCYTPSEISGYAVW
jgi:hypothetical protein